ncbi:MAG: hypothetical protein KGL39_40440, partial [Patescibacteria group bacterium]|nr:hypothetical protein [Patescibacteria group bacterium]
DSAYAESFRAPAAPSLFVGQVIENQPEPLPESDWPSDADALDQFWNAYPKQRRTEKANVAKKLTRLRAAGTVTWAELMAGVERYGRSSDVARGFAKGPMPWLNGGCWKDEIATRGHHDGNLGTGGQQNLGFAGIAGALRAKRLAREIDERDATADVRPGNRQGAPQLDLVRLPDRREESENPAPIDRR